MKILVQNRKARHDYAVLETVEAGICLQGTEVKSCRAHNLSLADAYARVENGEMWLHGMHIAPYEQGNRNNHPPRRRRKLLLHRREIRRLAREVEARGLTLIPLKVYLNDRSKIKVELGLCRGKNVRDKRQDMKKRLHEREVRDAVGKRR